MEQLLKTIIRPEKFSMTLLPSFAGFLLEKHLEKYVDTVIGLSEREELPLLKKLDRFSREELMELGKTSHGEILNALSTNTIHLQIEDNVRKWTANNLEVIDKDEVVAEDVTLSAFIKRRCLQLFIPFYTTEPEQQRMLHEEIDNYTTQEELISYNVYLKLQQEKLNKINDALKFQESLLLEAQELSDLGSFFMDYINPENSMSTPQVAAITGLSGPRDDEFFDRVHQQDRDHIRTQWEKALDSGGEFDYTFRYRHDHCEKRLHSRGIVTKNNGQVVHIKGTLRDITKIAELIERLTETELLNKEAQKLTHLGNWSWDIGSNTINWSDEMYRIYGLEPQSEEITFERFLSLIHPDSRETRINEINESLATGVVKDYTLKIQTPSGEIKILRGFGSMTLDANGQPAMLVGTCQDITREFHLKNELLQLNKELSVKNEELLRSNEELESFNYIASHDLQEPLRKIELFSEKILHQNEGLPDDINAMLQKVINAATRMRTLINDLMAFSQISLAQPPFETIDLTDVFDQVIELFAESIENGDVTFNVEPLPAATVIPTQFDQLITNILGNSIKYKKPDAPVTINVCNKVVTSGEMEFADAHGQYLEIAIADNGIGFEPEQKSKIFDLFKRLHSNEIYSGTGIGLAICKKIVQKHNGFIAADSVAGSGATFKIYIPFRS